MAFDFEESREECLFKASLAFPRDERLDFLTASADGDEELLAQAMALLEGYEQMGGDDAPPTRSGESSSARQRWATSNEEPGTVIGAFTLVRKIGEGGMGSVWEAEQKVPIARRVALKVIKLGMDTTEVVKRFERERQMLAVMEHPNIAQVYEAGATELGRPYFVMEFVEGQPITDYCGSHDLSLEDRLQLMLQVCHGIEHAHRKGIIHRDLKPSNILVSADGTPKIIDFGVAKAASDSGGTLFTRETQVLGTPAYMSPEQATGDASKIDTRTDVYSLGVVIYELLAGMPPFNPERLEKASVAEMQRILSEEDPQHLRNTTLRTNSTHSAKASTRPRRTFPISRDLDLVAMKALAKERAQRYQSATALADDLQHFLRGEAVSAVPPTASYLFGKFVRKHRAAVVSVAAIALALTLGLVASLIMGKQARDSREESQARLARMFSLRSFEKGQDGQKALAALWATRAAEIAEKDSEDHLANLTRAAIWTRETPVPRRAFHVDCPELKTLIFHPMENHIMVERQEKMIDDFTWQVWDILNETSVQISGNSKFSAMAWSPDGSLLAMASPDSGEITILRFPDLTELGRCKTKSDKTILHLAFNCDANLLAATSRNYLEVFTTEGEYVDHDWQRLVSSEREKGHFFRIAFSPTDPHCLATSSGHSLGRLYRVDRTNRMLALVTMQHHREPLSRMSRRMAPIFDQEGRTVSFNGRKGDKESIGITRFDASTGELLFDQSESNGEALTHSADGKYLIVRTRQSSKARVVNAKSGTIIATTGFRRQVTAAAFGRKSRTAIVASEDGTVEILSTPGWNSTATLTGHQRPVMAVALSPSGRFAATAQSGPGSSIVRVWNVDSPHHRFVATSTETRAVTSNDGSFFATAGHNRQDLPAPVAAQVFHTATGEAAGPQLLSDDLLLDAAFSPDNNILATAWIKEGWRHRGADPEAGIGSLRLWDWKSGTMSGDPVDLPSAPRSLAWHPSNNSIAISCTAGQIMVFDAGTRDLRRLRQTKKPLNLQFRGEIAYSASGETLATWSHPQNVYVIPSPSTEKPKVRRVRLGGRVSGLSFHGDRMIACVETNTRSGEPRLTITDPRTGELLVDPLPQPEWMESVAFAPDGLSVLTTGLDGLARIIDWRTGKNTCSPLEHSAAVYTGVFVPDSAFVLTGSDEGEFRISDSRTGIGIASFTLPGEDRKIREILVTPDGRTALYTGERIEGVGIVDLGIVHDSPKLGLNDLLEISALNAGATLDAEGHLHEIPTEEWLERWQQFRNAFPEHHN